MWQVSGGHGQIEPATAVARMLDHHEAGLTTWDLADHYGPAEDLIGEFRRQLAVMHGDAALADVQAFTKWVPRPGPMTRQTVEQSVSRSLRRMDAETLDLLQFHWDDYSDPHCLDALRHLSDLRDEGKIRHLAVTNFDTEHLREIVAHGIRVVSNQVQYSLIDQRPDVRMAPFCEEHGISMLTYGTLCGGLLSDAYLGEPEPQGDALSTRSLRKYKAMIDIWGGWKLFQRLLRTLRSIADKHGVSIANVATRYVLDAPRVAGVIVGVRLGLTDHRADNARTFDLTLDSDDHAVIAHVVSKARDVHALIGDCGAEYRAQPR
jgi:aryl-alcohol dehydrogenase-like predicted oxidoreductase